MTLTAVVFNAFKRKSSLCSDKIFLNHQYEEQKIKTRVVWVVETGFLRARFDNHVSGAWAGGHWLSAPEPGLQPSLCTPEPLGHQRAGLTGGRAQRAPHCTGAWKPTPSTPPPRHHAPSSEQERLEVTHSVKRPFSLLILFKTPNAPGLSELQQMPYGQVFPDNSEGLGSGGRRERRTTGISPQVQTYAGGLITHFLCEKSCRFLSIKGHEAHRVVTSAPTGSTEGKERAWFTDSRGPGLTHQSAH